MKIWKRNAIIATVLLFVCAGIYLNWSYNETDGQTDLAQTLDETLLDGTTLVSADADDALLAAANEGLSETGSVADYFAEVRLSRQEARESALTLLQEAMAYESDETGGTATAALEEVVSTALAEAQIESLIIAKGYADCVAYMSEEGISVAVAAPEEGLAQEDVALITDIIMGQSAYELEQIRIVEVR